jgi:hypothetical protein
VLAKRIIFPILVTRTIAKQSSEEKENDDSEEEIESHEENDAFSQFLHAYFEKTKNCLTLDIVKKKIADRDLWIRAPDPNLQSILFQIT